MLIHVTNTFRSNMVARRFSPNNPETTNKCKLMARNFMLNSIPKDFKSNVCLLLAGEQYSRCIDELLSRSIINYKNSLVIIPEIDRPVFEKIIEMAKDTRLYVKNRVKILNCDISEIDFHYANYQDIDLMCSWKNAYSLLEERLKRQREESLGNKVFMFTISERKGGGKQILYNNLVNLLKALDFLLVGFSETNERGYYYNGWGKGDLIYKGGTRIYCRRYIPNYKNRGCVEKLIVYRYSDSQPMLTCMIYYK